MAEDQFDYICADAQATPAKPLKSEEFDIERYCDYEEGLLEANRRFWSGDGGAAVYRRFRAPQVFSFSCKDMEYSLSLTKPR